MPETIRKNSSHRSRQTLKVYKHTFRKQKTLETNYSKAMKG